MNSASQLSSKGRVLALDVGKKRIGLAVSDELNLTAQGLPTLHRKRIREDLQTLKDFVGEFGVRLLLVGDPLHMSGDESRQSAYTREFGDRLSAYALVPVVYWDERLTSVQAERMLRAAGSTVERQSGAIDRMAAILLLESYLGSLQPAVYAGAEEPLG